MLFHTARTTVELLAVAHASPLQRYYSVNQKHLAPWEPARPDRYHSTESWRQRASEFQREYKKGVSLRLIAFQEATSDVVAVCNFTNITRGPMQACNLGYSIAHAKQGQGLMSEIVAAAVYYVFDQLELHRVVANYVPENHRSARLLEKLGFEKEGYAKSYLQIGGRWRDHVLTAKINPNQLYE
jgi:ribosomal-protein-alanine N-acetyltransferase